MENKTTYRIASTYHVYDDGSISESYKDWYVVDENNNQVDIIARYKENLEPIEGKYLIGHCNVYAIEGDTVTITTLPETSGEL